MLNQWASDHCHTIAGGTPIVALDMYEHSYHIDFGAKAGSYVDAFVGALRWDKADQHFDELTGSGGMTR
jgi:superoxide dismutase, Fe-Mn family